MATKKEKPAMKWYVIKVRNGRAKALKREIERQRKLQGLEVYVGRILIPRKRQLVVKRGAKGERRAEEFRMRFGRGYLFVRAALATLPVWKLLNNTVDSLGLMPQRYAPTPVPDEEISALMDEHKKDQTREVKVRLSWKIGDEVEIADGLFLGQRGKVVEITSNRSSCPKVKVAFQIMGTSVTQTFEHYRVDNPTRAKLNKKGRKHGRSQA